jgi:phosphoglucomutase
MTSSISPLAGKTLDPSLLLDVPRLLAAYFSVHPDPADPAQRIAFGTSGHRGSAFHGSFNEAHVLAISQAICHYRQANGIDGPLFAGIDTHALSRPALATALEVFTANGVDIFVDANNGTTPTPVISHAILTYNRGRTSGLADGIVLTPSHNPPEDGGYKYNPPNGGPAETDVTRAIEDAANILLSGLPKAVRRISDAQARVSAHYHPYDYIGPYVADLANVVDMEAIRGSGVKIGIDPLGGAAVPFWEPIIDRYKIMATVVSDAVDPTFRFMTADWDGRIRMDLCQRYRCRPARHRGRVGRTDEPEPLSRGRDCLPVRQPPGLARRSRDRQDRGQQRHHRPCGGQARPPAVRGARRLQMVRRRPA